MELILSINGCSIFKSGITLSVPLAWSKATNSNVLLTTGRKK